MFKVNDRDTRTMPNFEHISQLVENVNKPKRDIETSMLEATMQVFIREV